MSKANGLDGLIILGPGKLPFGYYSRAKTAVSYNGKNEIPIIVTGGKGHFCKNMKETEASILKRMLQEFGADNRVIKVEPEPSSNTYQNFEYSKGLIHLLEIKRLGVVTSSSHMERALRYGNKALNSPPALPNCNLYPVPVNHDFRGSISEICCVAYEQIIRRFLHAFS